MEIQEGVYESDITMNCACCNKKIYRGEEITRTLDSIHGMSTRSGKSRPQWVHYMCVPKNTSTEYFENIVNEIQSFYGSRMTEEDVRESVHSHGYWTHEKN
jgi:hypothetical protein